MYYLPVILSTLFRLSSFIFLRIIPTRLAQPVLPTLYLLYLSTTYLFPEGRTRSSSPLSTILFSLPSPSRVLTWTNVFINTLLIAAAADLALTPFFDPAHDVTYTRVGAIYPDSVKIQVRYPANESLVVLYRETISADWKLGPRVYPQQQFDWVDTVHLTNLWPSTKYEYTLATSANQSTLSISEAPIPFRTFPDPQLQSGSRFRFIATSCTTPNFPYRGPFHKNSIPGFDLLADYLERQPEPVHNNSTNETVLAIEPTNTDFLIFLGDFIYADVPVYIGDDKEAYRRLYRRNYASPSFKRVYEQLPVIHAYDDHEFINNYGGNSQDIAPFLNASAAYQTYAGNPNYSPVQPEQSFYTFQHGDVAFFVMDTRRYRSPITDPDRTYHTMLGEDQLTALYNWLNAVNTTSSFKFIVTSVPFTSLWTHDAQIDSWAGYPVEKAALLEAFHSVPNVILISGDRHEFAAIEFSSTDPRAHVVREISTSPLSMFYIPFIHTLQLQSSEVFTRNITGINSENITEEVPYERAIAYIPEGNSKWSSFEIDTKDRRKPILRLETIVDGKSAYQLEIVGAPSKPPVTSLGFLVSTNIKDLFDKIGLSPGRWF